MPKQNPRDGADELTTLLRRVEGLNAKEQEVRGLVERQQGKLAQTVEAVERYFSDMLKAVHKMEAARDDAERAQAFRDIGIAAEYARQGLPSVR
jgi:hypothetical protein